MDAIVNTGIIAVLVTGLILLAIVVLVGLFIMRRFIRIAGPDEALVISGSNKKVESASRTVKRTKENGEVEEVQLPPESSSLKVVVNGKAFVNPVTQIAEKMSLRSRKTSIKVSAQSSDQIGVNVEAVVIFKVSSDPTYVRRAAERFISDDAGIENTVRDQLEGALRGTVAQMSVKELIRERKKTADDISENAATELLKQGLIIDSFQISGITDSNGYIESLGQPEIEAKKRDAEIAQINADREINRNRISTNEQNLKEESQYEINQALEASKVGEERAKAKQAAELAGAEAEQRVLDQRAKNREAELDAEVRRKAEADAYAREQQALATMVERQKKSDADAYEREKKAQADKAVAENEAEAKRVQAAAEAEAERLRAEAEANANLALSEAEAAGIRAKGDAKAQAIEAEAKALEKNKDALIAQRIIDILPEMMTAWGESYKSVGNVTIFSGDGETASGHSARESASAIAGISEVLKNTIGVDIKDIISSNMKGKAMGHAFAESANTNDVVEGEISTDKNNRKI